MSLLITVGQALLVTAGLLFPGRGWALAGRWPLPWLATGVISFLAIFVGVVGLSLLGIPITLPTLGSWLAVVALAGGLLHWKREAPVASVKIDWRDWWLALPVIPLVAVA